MREASGEWGRLLEENMLMEWEAYGWKRKLVHGFSRKSRTAGVGG